MSPRHRAPVPARRRHAASSRSTARLDRTAERVGLVLAVACSGLAVFLVVQGLRTPAIAVAAAGLVLALAALVLGRSRRPREA